MPYGATRSPPNADMSAAALAISPASQSAGSGCNATVPSPPTSSITQYPTPIELLLDGGMFHNDPYWRADEREGPTVAAGPGAGPRLDGRRRRHFAAEPVAGAPGRPVGEPSGGRGSGVARRGGTRAADDEQHEDGQRDHCRHGARQ